MRVLLVAPHPDDAELACAALLGPAATILCCTHEADDRGAEGRRAAKVSGSAYLSLDLADGTLGASPVTLCRAVESAIDTARADVVAGPPLADEHPDHAAVAAAVRSATRRSGLTVVEYETPSTPPTWSPDTFLPVTAEQLAVREEALAEHASQLPHSYCTPGVLRARATVRGQWVGLAAAEAYRTVRRVRL